MINYGRRIGSHEKPAYGTVITDPFHPLSQGLVGYWLMNEGGGNTAYDISGHGNHGTLTNGPTWGGSKFGSGLRFDGTDDIVNFGDKADFQLPMYSWAMWIKGNTAPGTSVVTQPLWNADTQFQFSWDHPTAGFKQAAVHKSGSTWYKSQIQSTLFADVLYFIAGTYDGTYLKIYLNGNLEDTNPAPSPGSAVGDLTIGGQADLSNLFSGEVYEFYTYNRALLPNELKQLCHDPFCNLLRVPIRRYSVAAAGGLSILDYERATMRGAFRGIGRGIA